MTNILILIRHSLPEIYPSVPASEWHLSEVGKERADTLAGQLSNYDFPSITSSTEPKAIETAQIIANRLQLNVEIAGGLHEHERPQTAFRSKEEFRQTIAHLFNEPKQLSFGNETAQEASDRFDGAVQELLLRYPDRGLAIVSHGTVISLFAARHLKVDPYQFWQQLGLPCAIIFTRPELHLVTTISPVDWT